MKRNICWLLAILLCGCSPVPENKSRNIVYAAAEYCVDDECSEKVSVKYDEAEIAKLESYLNELSKSDAPLSGGEKLVKLVMIDDAGLQFTYTEEANTTEDGFFYSINDVMQNTSQRVDEDARLIHLIKSLKGEVLQENEILGYAAGEDFYVVSYNGQIMTQKKPNTHPYFEVNQYAGETDLSMLFYIDESFTEISQIKDQKRLLTGILNQMDFPDGYEPSVAMIKDQLLYSASSIDETSFLNKGSELFSSFECPQLSTSMLGVSGFAKYYYAEELKQFIKQKVNNYPISYTQHEDIILMPVYRDGQHIRLVKVRVRNTNYEDRKSIQTVKPIVNGGSYQPYYDYTDLFDEIVNHLDQFDLYDVEVDEQNRIKAVEVIKRAKQDESEPVQGSDFILNTNETNSIYTYRSISNQAEIYNDFMRNINCQIVKSELHENQDFISMTITAGYSYNTPQLNILIDKKDGVILDDGLLNERYFDNQLEARVLKQLADQKIEACALAYEDNINTPKCYVKPMIADVYDPNQIVLSFNSFTINDEGQLVMPVLIREYGGYSGTLEIIP